MTSAAGADRFAAVGQIETEVDRLLSGAVEGGWSARLVPRSPLGRGAVRVELGEDCVFDLDRLRQEDWIEDISIRPGHLYLKMETDALRRWVTRGPDYSAICAPVSPAGTPDRRSRGGGESLAEFRDLSIETALGNVLSALESDPVNALSANKIRVGEVDVPYGALRMRHGGTVTAADAADEVGRVLAEGFSPFRLSGTEQGHHALAVLMLATPREKHLHLDDDWIRRGASTFRCLDPALSPSGTVSRDGSSQPSREEAQKIRRLAIELNALPGRIADCANRLEPAYVARFVLELASQLGGVGLGQSDPLRRASYSAIEVALKLLLPDHCAVQIQDATAAFHPAGDVRPAQQVAT